jgi:wobble nucleotide-excising tRNase
MAARITNLRSMQGVGIYADRTAKSASLGFRQYNLIYGFNGSGKSTLSRVFASLEAGQIHPKLPVGCSFELAMDDGSNFGCPTKPSGLERRLLVFNSDFVEKNFQWSHGKASPVFFIGADQAKAAAELSALEAKLPKLVDRAASAEVAAKQADKALSTFKKDRAKLTASRLHQGNRKYEAPQLASDYALWASKDVALLTDGELKAAEDTRRLSEPMPTVEPITFDTVSIGKAFQFVSEMCGQTLSIVALDEVQRHPEMVLWLKEGHEFHERHDQENCLLCGNVFSNERLALLKGALDNQVDRFISRLAKTAERLQIVIQDLDALEKRPPPSESLQAELRSSFKESQTELIAKIRASRTHLEYLDRVLAEKRARPASPADASMLPSQAEVEDAAYQVSEALKSLNAIIERHNLVVADFSTCRENAAITIRKHFIAECRDDFEAHVNATELAQRETAAADAMLSKANSEAEALRQKIKTHGPAATVINKLIASYLGHGELTINAVDEGYELHRHGRRIEGLPSEGEKTAIAISYFLSKIESEGRKLNDLIIVVDDPISSLDTKALNFACSLVRSRLSGASQVFVLTHNQQCLNEFRKAWKNKSRPSDGKDPTASLLFIDVTIPKDGNKRVASLVEMSKLLREYDSEYHFLFSHVLKFSKTAGDYSEYGYMMPNVLRRVLDIFLAFKCPGGSGLPGKIDEICAHYPDLDRDRLIALERLAQVESHSDNLDDLISFSSMTLEETAHATEALLALMNHVDLRHMVGLRRICA